MFFLPVDKIRIKSKREKFMKKILGILALSCICILLGLSVKWYKDRDVSLVFRACEEEIDLIML